MLVTVCVAAAPLTRPSTAPTTRHAPATTRAATTAATTAPAPHAALPDPKKAPAAPFDISESATRAEAVDVLLRSMQSDVRSDRAVPTVKAELPVLTVEINARFDESSRLLEANPSLQMLENLQDDWSGIQHNLSGWADALKRNRDRLRGQIDQTAGLEKDWNAAKARAEYFLPFPNARDVIQTALESIDPTLDKITDVSSSLNQQLVEVIKLQQAVDAQGAQVMEVLESVRESRDEAFTRLFTRNEPPVWGLFGATAQKQSVVEEGQNSFRRQAKAIWAYIQRRRENVGIQFAMLAVFTVSIYVARKKVCHWSEQDPGFDRAKLLFASPVATAIVLSLVFSVWIYPQAPRMFWAIVGAVALVPTTIILRRLIDQRLFPILNALVVFYFFDQIRLVAAAVPFASRMLFLAQMLAAMLLIVSLIRSIRKQASENRVWQVILVISWLEFATFSVAFLASSIGYVSLASLLGDAALKSAYLAVILYGAISLAIALLVLALRTRPLAWLGMVRRHQPLLLRRLTLGMEWLAAAGWLVGLLASLTVGSAILDAARRVFDATTHVAGVDLSLGHVLQFGLVVWLSFLASDFIRFVLEEDVYDRFPMPGGLAYAISKMVHYVLLFVGFFMAIRALGYSLSNLTILASAFVVGVGLGMQNIVNNFVSGLILLFERPVKVGDVIQLNDVTGVVARIGIRASVLRTLDSSEIIIPNGNLISNQVVNWTLSNRQRGIAIAVTLGSSTDPNHVLELLLEVAAKHPQVVGSPAPQAFLTKFGADSFSYELHVWTNEAERWIQIRSELSIALNQALVKEAIAIK